MKKLKTYFNAIDVQERFKDMPIDERCKHIEYVNYIESIKSHRALTVIASFFAVFFLVFIVVCAVVAPNPISASACGEVVALAAAPSDNTLHIYPGSMSIVADDYDYTSTPLFMFDGHVKSFDDVEVPLTVPDGFFDDGDFLCQYIFYVETRDGDMLYLDGVANNASSYFGVAGDGGWGDYYFVFTHSPYNSGENVDMLVTLFRELEFYSFYDNVNSVYIYDIRLINTNGTAGNFFSIVGDGISFGFESIAGGITYTVDNLFFEDGFLSDYSVIIFAMTGVSLALAVIKYILRMFFSLGGRK